MFDYTLIWVSQGLRIPVSPLLSKVYYHVELNLTNLNVVNLPITYIPCIYTNILQITKDSNSQGLDTELVCRQLPSYPVQHMVYMLHGLLLKLVTLYDSHAAVIVVSIKN